MKRDDDFIDRRKHLEDLTEEQLELRFWEVAEKLVDPLISLAEKNTSPSIERSVLLRMGFSSLEAQSIVDEALDRGLLGKGVGNLVYKLSKDKNLGIREAGLVLSDGLMWDELSDLLKKGEERWN